VTGATSNDETAVDTSVDVARIRLTITTPRVSDTEVAAITVALLAATSGAPAAGAPAGPAAWRHAGMLEAATDRRVRTPAELRHPA
jgi:hypothetical protein